MKGDVLDQGYLIDFKVVYETSFNDNWLIPEDFKIDSLYMVNDDEENGHHLMVAAVSSKTLRTKTILVNTLVQCDDLPIYNELYTFVRQFIGRLLKLKQFK